MILGIQDKRKVQKKLLVIQWRNDTSKHCILPLNDIFGFKWWYCTIRRKLMHLVIKEIKDGIMGNTLLKWTLWVTYHAHNMQLIMHMRYETHRKIKSELHITEVICNSSYVTHQWVIYCVNDMQFIVYNSSISYILSAWYATHQWVGYCAHYILCYF